MKWISVKESLPKTGEGIHNSSYLICGHEWFGIAFYDSEGWHRAFIGEFPTDEGQLVDDDYWLNTEGVVLWYAEIPIFPVNQPGDE
jgi:hypothetical protein